jgi:hypothetical protein
MIADFPGAVSEGPGVGGIAARFEEGNSDTESYSTTCEYNPPERT